MRNSLILLLPAIFLLSCNSGAKKYSDTATSGSITISVDETFKPVIEGQIDTFHALYKYARISARYVSEQQAYRDLLNDSARLIIVTRKPDAKEMEYFSSLKLTPRITKIATDAIALITNKNNPAGIILYSQLKNLFTGRIKDWNQVDASSSGKINIVFDNRNSSTVRYVLEEILKGDSLSGNIYAVNTNEEVVNYVQQNKNAVGVIGVNWISDTDDPSAQKFLGKIKVLEISPADTMPGSGDSYKPYQAYIAQKFYPLCRDLYIVSREARTGLGTGFASFAAGDKGQRIILKSGLLPATMPVRLVGVKNM